MEYVNLGRSGLVSSVVGLGGGGPSRLGLATGSTPGQVSALIRRAVDLGVTLFDTKGLLGAADAIVGKALRPVRDQVLISTKVNLAPAPWPMDRLRTLHRVAARAAERLSLVTSAGAIRAQVERTLRALGTDHVDILHLHAVLPGQYAQAVETALPVLAGLKAAGRIRAIGITESFTRDPRHTMLARALDDGFPDVVMTGFNLLNRAARFTVIPGASVRRIGVIGMFVLRQGLRSESDLAGALRRSGNPLAAAARASNFMRVLKESGIESLTEAAWRFGRHEPGLAVVLIGTGNVSHLERNIAAALAPPLPAPVLRAIEDLS